MAGEHDLLLELAATDPERFRRLMAMADKIILRPHAGQQLVLDSNARFKVMNCGRRWGKTKLAAYILTKRSRQPNQMLWWVAPTYRVVKRGYEEVLKQLPNGVLEHEPPPSTNFDAGRPIILRFKNGTKMEFYSAERPEGMLGAGVDFAVLDEAALMKPSIWNQIVRPTLMDREGGGLMISTPRGKNWFYKVWRLGQEGGDPSWQSWTFESASNPTLPPNEVEEARKVTPRMEFEQEYLAKFLAAGSSVFILDDRALQQGAVYDNGLVEDLQEAGFDVVGVNFTTHKANMVRLLANDLERSRAYVLGDYIDEFEEYVMDITPGGRFTYSAPDGSHDDIVSAKMLAHWGAINEGVPEAQVLTGEGVGQSDDTERDPWDDDLDEDGDYSDLIDEPGSELEDIGLPNPLHRPTPQELLNRPDVWF